MFIYLQRPAEKRRTGFLRAALEDGAEAGGRSRAGAQGAAGLKAARASHQRWGRLADMQGML